MATWVTREAAMHVAVLLLTLSDNPRRTTFTREWAERCVAVAGDYYAAQSAGRVTITWTVHDWLELPMTETEWLTLSATGIDGVVDLVTPMFRRVPSLESVSITSWSGSNRQLVGGTTPGAFTYLGAVNFTPSFIGHELGHRFGARATRSGRRRRGDSATSTTSA